MNKPRIETGCIPLLRRGALNFTPKYCKPGDADQGASVSVPRQQSEMHFGPHADWFWDVERSGGGVFMDMGCHGLRLYWFLGGLHLLITALMALIHGTRPR